MTAMHTSPTRPSPNQPGNRINQLALQYLITWHRDGADCQCIPQSEPIVQTMLATLARRL